ncbi:zf-DHHC-domain-containing protein [Piromyces finnis]|uniref:Palmitoyltransferase n=1 Tax=Piromyces finnis TaxID=1754191 RepID=A0A1Y1VJB4_9FUNG|nr:zf-DHHC-domain-containing protein [Piromyces finnis]|eukprot:ORX57279.1 zf-DHHC-domain-containing protein [Piromyces finnis]
MNEISIEINLINKKSKNSSKSVKSSKSYDVDLLNSKSRENKTESIKTSKSVDKIYNNKRRTHENKLKKKKSKSSNTIDLYGNNNNEKNTEIYFDYSSLDNLKTRNNLLDPIQYPQNSTSDDLNEIDDEPVHKNYKVIDIDNNIKLSNSKNSETIIDINNKEKENNNNSDEKDASREKEIIETETNDSKMIELTSEKESDNNNEDDKEDEENYNSSKESLINKCEDDSNENKEEENDKISEEEEKRRKLIEHYLKMPIRKSGFQCPWSLKQIFGFILIAYSAAINYYLIFNGEYNKIQKMIVLVISSVIIFSLIIFGFILIISDPSDDSYLKDTDENKDNNNRYHYCKICKKNVNCKSLHCKYCNKCILRFDHHCKFVNNCIGIKNYKLFILSLSFATLYFIIVLLNIVYFFYLFIFTETEIALRKRSVINLIIQIGLLFYLVIACVAMYFLFDLIRLHILLKIRHMTTNEYSHWLKANRRSLENRANKKKNEVKKSQELLNINDKEIKSKKCQVKNKKRKSSCSKPKSNIFEKKPSDKIFPI